MTQREMKQAEWDHYDAQGYVILENVLSQEKVAEIRVALTPYLEQNLTGRNDFEGMKSNRVYALLAKGQIFAELATHPLAMAFVERELGQSALLSACLAINLHPEETVQPWHYDDSHIQMPLPRQACGVSAFWAIDATTEENGATEIIPGSHLWPGTEFEGQVSEKNFADKEIRDVADDPGSHPDAIKAVMPSGSLMIAKGTLWHRGGANRSSRPRLIITPQYCSGWARQLENMVLAVPPEIAQTLPRRARELLGYSIHPPFMGYVNGTHPAKSMPAE
jgi:ectoine hydroxylase-related dioxygenase (phytanoyl-CoA dioxygenase family)